MDSTLYLKALILGIVEGLTEFLPISSTGHLILVGDLLDFNDAKGKLFEIVIQSGAMLAVVWEYRQRFGRVLTGLGHDPGARRFVTNLVVAFIPAALLGLAFGSLIKQHLFQAIPVASAFIIGGMIIGMITRTALGHTGAPLRAGWPETTAYVLVHAAASSRVVAGLLPASYYEHIWAAGHLWALAFLLYFFTYLPRLVLARRQPNA